MVDLESDFEFLVATVRRSVSQLRACASAHVDAARGKGLVRGTGLRAHIEETLDAIGDRVDASETRFAAAEQDIERSSVIDSLRLLNRNAVSMHEAAGWLDSAEESDVHIDVLYFTDEAAAAITGVDADVVPVGDSAYQYATVSWPFAPILDRLKGEPTGKTRPIVVFFPPQEGGTVLLHSLFAHELAHSASFEHHLVEEILGKHHDTEAFKSQVASIVRWLEGTGGIDAAEARIRLNDHLSAWTTEFLCDAIAIEYLGPTYLLAFAAVVLSTSWSEPNQTHPPTTLRVGAMVNQLRLRGWEALLQSAMPKTYSWLEGIGAIPHHPVSELEKFLVDWTRAFAGDICATAASRLGSNAYPPSDFESVRREVAELLERQILPAQLQDGKPIDRRTIFLAGWLQVFVLYDDLPSSISEGTANDEYQDFLGTAMEMSAVLETWKRP